MNQIEQTLDSREVAEMVGKKHYNLMRDIKGYAEELNELKIEAVDFFEENLMNLLGMSYTKKPSKKY